MLTVGRSIFVMMIVVMLTACSTETKDIVTPEEILEKVEEEHDAIESVYVIEEVIEHLNESLSYVATEEIDFKNGIIYYDIEESNTIVYKDREGIMIILNGEHVDPALGNDEIQDFKFTYELKNQQNPLKQLTVFDENFYEHLTMTEDEDNYTFSYTGNDEQKKTLIQGIVWSNHIQANTLADSYENLAIEDTELEMTAVVDKETNRIQMFEIYIKYSPPSEFNTKTVEFTTINKYSKYNEVEAIEKPKDVAMNVNEENVTLSEEEVEKAEKEASHYVDALIQATVFQDVEKYVSKVPGPQSEDEKREEGSMQQSFFREIYEQNTMENMKDFGVTEEQVKEFSAAFMKALSITSYEMIDSKMVADDEIRVTLSIRGFDNTNMNLKVEEKLIEEHEADKITDDELLNRNLELIIEAYNSNEDLLDPKETVVDVIRNDQGTYTVLLQDQYLQSFVQ